MGRRGLRSALRRGEEPLIVGAAFAILALAVVPPLVAILLHIGALAPDLTEQHPFLHLLGELSAIGSLLAESVTLASATTALATTAGIALGLVFAKTRFPGRRLAFALHVQALFLPPLLLALGWFHIAGRQGALGSEASSRFLFSPLGVVAVCTAAFTPVVTVLVALALQGVDETLEEAARIVARPWRVASQILLPMIWPAAALAAVIVFTLAFSELGVPMFLRVRTYPTAVFARLGGIDYSPGEAAALALPLLGISLCVLAAERAIASRQSFSVRELRTQPDELVKSRLWRGAPFVAGWVAAAVSVAPIAALLLRAGRAGFAALPDWIGDSIGNSLLAAGSAATIVVGVALPLGWALARDRPGARWMDGLAVTAFLAPASLLGVGLIQVWNRPATRAIYQSAVILVLGYVARYSTIGVRTVALGVAQSARTLEEAGAVFGAGLARRLAQIVLPLHRRSVAGAWLLTLLFCLRDLETSVFDYPPGGEPLTVRILTVEANGPEPVVAAMAIVQVLLTTVVLGAGALLLLRKRRSP